MLNSVVAAILTTTTTTTTTRITSIASIGQPQCQSLFVSTATATSATTRRRRRRRQTNRANIFPTTVGILLMVAFLVRHGRSRSFAMAWTMNCHHSCNHKVLSRAYAALSSSISTKRTLRNSHAIFASTTTTRLFSTLESYQSTISQDNSDNNKNLININKNINDAVTCYPITAPFEPMGDQPQAIQQLLHQLEVTKDRFSILQGITGTGKTLVMSHVIAKHGKPTLVLCHNKTLAAQVARELRAFLGHHAVELFVSYYNHYVPESFNEATGTYVAKKSSINADIDTMRHRATRALLTRPDVVVVASVSCIYGLGLPKDYLQASQTLSVGDRLDSPDALMEQLQAMLYQKETEDQDFERGKYQHVALGESRHRITLWPPHESFPLLVELERQHENQPSWEITSIQEGRSTGHYQSIQSACIFPAKHHVMSPDRQEQACMAIEEECEERVKELVSMGKFQESNRLQSRVSNDLLMLRETGFCSGGENYSRHFAGRAAGEPPDTLMDYLGINSRDWLLMVDESHVTLPQLRAMYGGDRARKERLVKHGYRLPSALDNRPLKEDEFWERVQQAVFVSATPSRKELELAEQDPIHMIIRPTFVVDPVVEVRPSQGQLEDLVHEVRVRAKKKERTLAVALTKRDAEDLADYLNEHGVNSTYIHSGLTTHERADALKALQNGSVDCLVGVNLLREGLDLPQVSLVAILNADSEGFLRSESALLQMVGRAARNIQGTSIFYANRITNSMKKCMDDTKSRREKQLSYNRDNECTMKSTKGSSMLSIFDLLKEQIANEQPLEVVGRKASPISTSISPGDIAMIHPDVTVQVPVSGLESDPDVVSTEHVPNTPGVYFWKDQEGGILYIGKSNNLRRRVMSYLQGTNLSTRIKVMMKKARSIDFILTKTDRDALLLESNLIKHHQPPYNVLLKDDESYPYICATLGETYPRFSAVPRRYEGGPKTSKYRYFGPYPHFKEINTMLESIEAKYDLRAKSFEARHGSTDMSKEKYQELFQKALDECFLSSPDKSGGASLAKMRAEFEEAGLLFDSEKNRCRDVVVFANIPGHETSGLVHVVQLRDGLVAGRFSYTCELPSGLSNEEDYVSAMQEVLEHQHYPSGEETTGNSFPFFPNEVLMQYLPGSEDMKSLNKAIRMARKKTEPDGAGKLVIRKAATKGPRAQIDERAMDFSLENAQYIAQDKALGMEHFATRTSLDGTGLNELAGLLNLDKIPDRIECYDISHSQGNFPVGSKVVFRDGKAVPSLYRKFNIKTVDGIDDYASLEETLSRRFKRAWINGEGGTVPEDDPWSLPDVVVIDGGPGQLNAAVKGMAKARIFPAKDFLDQTDSASSNAGDQRSATVVVCALAKNQEELFVYGVKGPINELPDSPALLLLRSLRDESHRFALKAHRSRRSVLKSG